MVSWIRFTILIPSQVTGDAGEVRQSEMRRLRVSEKASFNKTRFLLLKNPWNLRMDEKERLSTLVRWNIPIIWAYYLKEAFQLFWDYRERARAEQYLRPT